MEDGYVIVKDMSKLTISTKHDQEIHNKLVEKQPPPAPTNKAQKRKRRYRRRKRKNKQ